MIKVNLLKNIGVVSGGNVDSGGAVVISQELQKAATIRAVVIVLFPLALFGYEKFNLSVLQTEIDGIRSQVSKIEEEKASFGSVAPKVEKYTKEKKEIETQVGAIRDLTKNRLREVKTLDALQSFMPDQAWLSSLAISGNSVQLEGFTLADDGVSRLIKALESSVLFSKVTPKSTTKIDTSSGSAKKFELEFRVGK